jgi:hypothetical protein
MAHDQVKEITNEEGEIIEGMLIYKWNHKALRHYKLEKEMELRQQQQEEQAMEIRDTIIETQQQQKHKNKKDKKRKKITKTNHTTEWIQEWLVMITPHPGPQPVLCFSRGVRRDQLESAWFFTYWVAGVAGDNDSPPPRGQ